MTDRQVCGSPRRICRRAPGIRSNKNDFHHGLLGDPELPTDPDLPLSGFVIYDGSWVMDNSTLGMTQTIEGIYDAVRNVPGKMTFIDKGAI